MHEVLTNQEVAAFWATVKTLLKERKRQLARGPRSMLELAEWMGVPRTTLHWQASNAKSLPVLGGGVSVQSVAAALDAGDCFAALDVAALLEMAGVG